MGENSDFIHSYVPWMSFQRDRFKYHLKYKIRKSFLKKNSYTSHLASYYILLSLQCPRRSRHFIINNEGIPRQFSMYMHTKDWKSVWYGKQKARAMSVRIRDNYVLLSFGRAKNTLYIYTHIFTLSTSPRTLSDNIWHLVLSMPRKVGECCMWDKILLLNQ